MAEKNKELKSTLRHIVEDFQSVFESISDFVYKNPELGGEEYSCCNYLSEILKAHGFVVTTPYETLPTAFVAQYGDFEKEGLTIGFLAEYDALPGYERYGGNAHACGHNWIAATMCGCGIALSKLQKELGCKIAVIGTPAEETFGAKYDMVNLKAFDYLDMAFQAHLDECNTIESVTLAMNSMEFVFKGVAAHAAQHPEKGINALDGVIAMFNGVNALRQHVSSDVRIHGIITAGGQVTNIVPDYAACKFSFRSRNKANLKEVRERIIKIAEGAALSSGAKVSYKDYENPFDDMVNVPTLMEITAENLAEVGIKNFVAPEDCPPPGSSDVGNVSHVCPTLFAQIDLEAEAPLLVHDEKALEVVNGPYAYQKMRQIIEGFCGTVIDLCLYPEKGYEIKEQHRSLMGHNR